MINLKTSFGPLSIRKIGLIGANLAAFTVFVFALIIIHQEYQNYQKDVTKILSTYKNSQTQKDKILEKTRDEHKKKVMRYIIGVGGLSLFMYFTIFAISRVISYIIENEMDNFINNFEQSAKDFHPLDKENFTFLEFKSMVDDANILIKEIQSKQNELEFLNSSLEDTVKAKTLKLQNLVVAQDEFVKKSIHEINTPLAIILANIDLLKMKQIQNKQLTNIESASKIINNIFNDLSYLVKKDRVVYEKQKINLSAFVQQRIDFFDEVARANKLYFAPFIEENLEIFISEIHLARIVDNNLSNAIKYSFANNPIKITLKSSSDNHIVFEILTYSQELKDKDKIFDEYYREHASRGGFGLGLKIVKDICDENKIKIKIESNSEFTIFSYIFKRLENENIIA